MTNTIPSSGQWGDIADLLNENFSERLSFAAISSNTQQSIPSDSDAAAFITDLVQDNVPLNGFEIDALTGSIKNISGAEIEIVTGVVSVHVKSANQSSSSLYIFSETSPDGVTWTKNGNSAREEVVGDNADNYSSKSSQFFNIPNNGYIRFRFFASSSNITFDPISITADGETVTGPAFRLWISEK